MNIPKLLIRLGIAGLALIGAVLLARHAYATNKPAKPPAPVVIIDKERDYSAALIGAGITAWIMHRRAKRNRPLVLEPKEQTCPTTEEKVERVFERCVAK